MADKKYEIDMLNGPIFSRIVRFSVPMVISGILQLLFNAADIIVVGNFDGEKALAAVGSTTSLIILIINLFIGLSVGANVVAAKHFGAGQRKDVYQTVHTSMAMSIYIGLALMAVGVIFSGLFLEWMNTPAEIHGMATDYMRIIFIGMPASMIYNFGYAILRVKGDTKRPLYYLIFAGIINVALNLLFVIVFRMSVSGVATATSISQAVSALLIIRCLTREESMIKLYIRKIRIFRPKLRQIIKIGLPAGIQGVVFSVSNVIIQAGINSFGTVVVAGNTAASNLEGFVYYAMNPFSQAAITFTSQNIGAGRYGRINRILVSSLISVTVIGLAMGAVCLIFGNQLLGLYTDSPAVIAEGMYRLSVIVMTFVLCGIMEVFAGSIRGMGHSVMPMAITIAGVCGVRLIWIATVFAAEHTKWSLYISFPISWVFTIVLYVFAFIFYRRKLGRTAEASAEEQRG